MYALIDSDGVVVVYQADQAVTAKGWRCLPVEDERKTAGVGETLDGPIVTVEADKVRRVWTAVKAPAPAVVSMAQARVALDRLGLLADVETAVAAVGGEVAIAWEYATEVSRYSTPVAALATALDLDDAALDDLFREAGSVRF